MTALLLDPHGDDAALFSAFNAIRHKPIVIVPMPTVPEHEIRAALGKLGCTFEIGVPSSQRLREASRVFAPAIHVDGHPDHNDVGQIAKTWAAPEALTEYLTYAPRGQRSRDGVEVVPEPAWIAAKLEALSNFPSQIFQPSTRPWFFDLLDLREWVAA